MPRSLHAPAAFQLAQAASCAPARSDLNAASPCVRPALPATDLPPPGNLPRAVPRASARPRQASSALSKISQPLAASSSAMWWVTMASGCSSPAWICSSSRASTPCWPTPGAHWPRLSRPRFRQGAARHRHQHHGHRLSGPARRARHAGPRARPHPLHRFDRRLQISLLNHLRMDRISRRAVAQARGGGLGHSGGRLSS